jgi:acetyl/propionyl-CoA carboxylase alpha subunit
MNCRINAEDPSRNFAPSPGRVEEFVPPGGPGIRIDTALVDGTVVPEYYDSLIAKIASSGRTRETVIQRLKGALSETIITGVETTIPLHQTILKDKRFLRGEYHTQLLDNEISTWDFKPQLSKEEIAMLYLTLNYPFSGQGRFQLQTSQTRWRNAPQTEPTPRPPLFVEGL